MIVRIILLVILIILNAIFSASELAFLSINKYDLNNSKDKTANLIKKILADESLFLSTIQIGITLAGFLASAFAADYFADYFMNTIKVTYISQQAFRIILIVVITFILSYFTLLFGELVPKKIARSNPYKIARLCAPIISFVRIIFYPLIMLLTTSTNYICKIFNIKDKNNNLTEEDIKKMVVLGETEGVVEDKEREYILNVFEFNDVDVRTVMTPVDNVVAIDIDNDLKHNLYIIKQSKYTRFPVYQGDINNIIGIVNVKDFILIYNNDTNGINLYDILRPVHKLEANEKIDDAFRWMQENKEKMCTVHEQGKFIGVVTVEDAVEEIVGNIYDEYDEGDD